MGCDGGTVTNRRDLIVKTHSETAAHPTAETDATSSQWTMCSLSSEPLREPIVCDAVGRLYNKETVLRAILERRLPKEKAAYLSLKTLIPVLFSSNTDCPSGGSSSSSSEGSSSSGLFARRLFPYMCPVSMQPIGLKNGRFVLVRKCSHVFSEKCLKELSLKSCPVCGSEWNDDDDDLLILNGTDDEVKILKEKFLSRRDRERKSHSASSLAERSSRRVEEESEKTGPRERDQKDDEDDESAHKRPKSRRICLARREGGEVEGPKTMRSGSAVVSVGSQSSCSIPETIRRRIFFSEKEKKLREEEERKAENFLCRSGVGGPSSAFGSRGLRP